MSAFLDRLAAHVPAPGGGVTAALHAAQDAAPVAMVARYTTGARYEAHASDVSDILAEANALRERCSRLAAEDAAAFNSVARAYKQPKATAAESRSGVGP